MTLPAGYKQAMQNGTLQDLDDPTSHAEMGVYTPNPNDDETVDPAALTSEQQEELSQYAAQLINSLRQQYGSPLLHVNSHIMSDTNTLIEQQDEDNVKGTHDQNALTKAYANDWDVNWDAECMGSGIENANIPGNPTPTLATMDQLKNLIYNDIRAMVSQDEAGWGHATDLVNEQAYQDEGFAIGIDKFGYVHFEFATSDSGKLDSTMEPLPTDNTSALQKEANDLQNQLTQAQNDVANKQAALNQANQNLTNAKNDLTNATNAVSQAQSQLANAQKQLQNDENALSQAQAQLTKDENAAKDLPAAQKANDAKIAQDQQNLTNAQNKLNNDQKKLQAAQANLTTAQSKLDQLKKELADAEAQQKKADSANAQAHKDLSNAQNAFNHAQDTLSNAKKTYANSVATYRQKKQALTDAQTALANAQNAMNYASGVHTTADLGNSIALGSHQATIAGNDVVSADTVNGETVSQQKTCSNNMSRKNEMPQTGEANNSEDVAGAVALGFASILAGLGLGYKRRH